MSNVTHISMAFAVALGTAAFAPFAQPASADEALQRVLREYCQGDERGRWANAWMPQASGQGPAAIDSADQQLKRIAGAYNRELLDRGGWINTYASNSIYASGQPLLAVAIGQGRTERVVKFVR